MINKGYSKLKFKVPKESEDYTSCSDFVVTQVEAIIKDAIESKKNKIMINTNLKLGLPMENINKVAGPFVEAWCKRKVKMPSAWKVGMHMSGKTGLPIFVNGYFTSVFLFFSCNLNEGPSRLQIFA